ncbi:MAG: thiamine phosphate synthase [Clostridia bacterium]|nr:thiamine phosphate synthase [Clostridia bacterium]
MKRFTESMLRLYALTDPAAGPDLVEQVRSAILGGATMIQLRDKTADDARFLEEARRLKEVCQAHQVPLIINDRIEIALACGADGVHVGQSDLPAGDVRARIGPDRILGVTAKTVEQARAAEAAGADYLGSGAVFGSTTKPGVPFMTMDRLREITASVRIPVVAIGGISRQNIAGLAGTGIRGVAVVSGIFSAPDIYGESVLLRQLSEQLVSD